MNKREAFDEFMSAKTALHPGYEPSRVHAFSAGWDAAMNALEYIGECDRCDRRTSLVLMDLNANEAICRDCVTYLKLDSPGSEPTA